MRLHRPFRAPNQTPLFSSLRYNKPLLHRLLLSVLGVALATLLRNATFEPDIGRLFLEEIRCNVITEKALR